MYFRSPPNTVSRGTSQRPRAPCHPWKESAGGERMPLTNARRSVPVPGLGVRETSSMLRRRLLISQPPWVGDRGRHWGHKIASHTTVIYCVGANHLLVKLRTQNNKAAFNVVSHLTHLRSTPHSSRDGEIGATRGVVWGSSRRAQGARGSNLGEFWRLL